MKLLYILPLVLLTGCVTVPVKHSMPEMPPELSEKCPLLKQVADGEGRLTELLKVVTENYTTYYECSAKNESLVKWYQRQKTIHDDVFNK